MLRVMFVSMALALSLSYIVVTTVPPALEAFAAKMETARGR